MIRSAVWCPTTETSYYSTCHESAFEQDTFWRSGRVKQNSIGNKKMRINHHIKKTPPDRVAFGR